MRENDPAAPAAHLCHHFTLGDIRNYDDVYAFGKKVDVLTIEIESVNVEALEKLEEEGVKIFPRPAALRIIKNKIHQKEYYNTNQIPTAAFKVTKNRQEILHHVDLLPAVHKIGEGGYDGRGVQLINNTAETALGFDEPAVLERQVNIHQEIAQIIAINEAGQTALYPPVDMVFNQRLNLLDYQISPADIPKQTLWRIEAISLAVVKGLNSPGIFAVELFIDKAGDVFVNETAPRVHNSGHHTIEGNFSSQFDMLWRVMLNYPLGNTAAILPAAIVNLVGEENYSGPAVYEGLNEVLAMDNVFVHIYGKMHTKPGRKMGHVTVLSREKQELIYKAGKIKTALKIISA